MNRTFAIPILLFVTLLLGVYFLWPKYTQFEKLKDEISKKELDLQQEQNYFLNLQKISTDLENHKEALEKVNSALPEKYSLPSLMNFFQAKASESGLILGGISRAIVGSRATVEEEVAGEAEAEKERLGVKIQEIYLNLKFTGYLSSFENFLETVEKSARIMEVETISLGTEEEGLAEFSLLIKVHSY